MVFMINRIVPGKDHKYLWKISNIISLVLLVTLLIMWTFINNRDIHSNNIISNPAELDRYIFDFKSNYVKKDHIDLYMPVRTGIYIQSYEFVESNTVKVSGYVWQKIDKTLLKKQFKPGIVFPDAKEIASFVKAYEYEEENYHLIGWRFHGVSLLQNFDYSDYPFEILTIKIQLWAEDFYNYSILVPDLSSYLSTKKDTVFALDDDIVKQGFDIKETYFDLVLESYDTSFGDSFKDADSHYLELFFNIVAKRHLINSVLIHFLPIIGIWCFLFAITMIISNDKQFADRVNLSTTQVFGALSGIILSVILMGSSLRKHYFDQPILFLEYFYIITFIMIILVSYDAYIMTAKRKVHSVFHHNILPKTAFWPLILLLLNIITIFKFFLT